MEIARWEKYMDARMNGFLKKRPETPRDLCTFEWERDKAEDMLISRPTEQDAEALTEIFKKLQG